MLAADEAHLLNLSIAAACQRQGYGSLLLRRLCEVARGRGARLIFLEVRPSNVAGLRLYERHGFQRGGPEARILSCAGRARGRAGSSPAAMGSCRRFLEIRFDAALAESQDSARGNEAAVRSHEAIARQFSSYHAKASHQFNPGVQRDRAGRIARMDWAELRATVAACTACGCAGPSRSQDRVRRRRHDRGLRPAAGKARRRGGARKGLCAARPLASDQAGGRRVITRLLCSRASDYERRENTSHTPMCSTGYRPPKPHNPRRRKCAGAMLMGFSLDRTDRPADLCRRAPRHQTAQHRRPSITHSFCCAPAPLTRACTSQYEIDYRSYTCCAACRTRRRHGKIAPAHIADLQMV